MEAVGTIPNSRIKENNITRLSAIQNNSLSQGDLGFRRAKVGRLLGKRRRGYAGVRAEAFAVALKEGLRRVAQV
jgi:hypothetical protein